MRIAIQETPSATWELEGSGFWCTHDAGHNCERVEADTIGNDGEHTTYNTSVDVCADPDCDEQLGDRL